MSTPDSLPTSFRRRYELYRAREIEFYKQVLVRASLIRIADEARGRIEARSELRLGDALLAAEVDSIIAERMSLPPFRAWMRSQHQSATVRQPSTLREPAAVRPSVSLAATQLAFDVPALAFNAAPVLVLQPRGADVWRVLCAEGRTVIVVEPDHAERDAVQSRASRSGWAHLVRAVASPAALPRPTLFSAVLYSPAACADLSDWQTADLIDALQTSTVRGGVHVVDGLMRDRDVLPRSILRRSYATWLTRANRGQRDWRLVATRA